MATINQLLTIATNQLQTAGITDRLEDARRIATRLMAELLNCNYSYLIAHGRDLLTPADEQRYHEWLARRLKGEPLQYITGVQEFYGRDFQVSPAVLIPRPETELIIEAVLPIAKKLAQPRLLDLCTGSGCIGVTLAAELPTARITALDISFAAIEIARINGTRHQVADRIDWLVSDLCTGLIDSLAFDQQFDICCANPPYVALEDEPTLAREVREHEPALALFAAEAGLAIVRRLFNECAPLLRPDGLLFCEIGYGQETEALALVDKRYWQPQPTIKDLQGIPRTIVLKKLVG